MAGGRGFGRLRHYRATRRRGPLRLAPASSLLLSALVLLAIAPAALAETKPVNTALPTISGTLREGIELSTTKGSWTGGGLSYAYQWQRCPAEGECTNVGTNSQKYEAVYADVGAKLRVIVTATNKIGSAEATSAQRGPVEPALPKNKEPPVISGIAKEGQLLTVSTGVWEGSPALKYKYQWERCNTEGIGCIKLGEKAKQGETPKEEEEREQREKETEKEEAEVEEGPKQHKYVVTQADIGHTLRATVTDTNLAGSKEARSEHTETVTAGPPVSVNLPTIAGDLREGGTLTASEGTWRGTTPIEYSFKWESCNAEHVCTETSGQTHTLGEADVSNTIRMAVTAHNAYGTVTASSVASPQVLHANDDFAVGWGEDYRGELGTIYKNIWEANPVLVEGQTGISAIAAGGFTLALHNDGTVASMGGDLYGQLGDEGKKATWQKGVSHVAVRNLTEVRAVSADTVHALALRNDGTVWAWGTSAHGQLGNGRGGFEGETGESERKATEVTALKSAGVTSIATGGGSDFAVLSNGEVRAWGDNHYGQLGVAPWGAEECKKLKTCEVTTRKKPSQEVEEGKKRQVELTEHLCVGDAGWDLCSKLPRTVVEADGKTALTHVIAVSGGGEAAFALLDNENKEVVSWGGDGKGQLGQHVEPGTGKIFGPTGPVMINATVPLKHVVAIAGGYRHALALLEDGSVVGWGDNTYGALGELTGEECTSGGKKFPCSRYATTLSLPGGVHATAIAAGTHTSAVLGSDGKVYTVGSDKFGQLGRGPKCENTGGRLGDTYTCYSRKWEAVPGLEHVQAISMNATSVIALVSHQASPPLPVIADEPLSKSLKLEWGLPESESATLLSYRVWEHPGDQEASEEGSGEGGTPGEEEEEQEEREKEQEATETGEGTAPTNTTLPVIKAYEVVEGKKEPVRNEAAVGQLLEATSGNWNGTPTIEFDYRWLRCNGSKCTWIPGATHSEYEPTVEDVGYTIEVKVTAHNNVLPRGRVTSEPSPMVAAKGEKVATRVTQIPLKGQNNLSPGPLEHVEYEVTLLALSPPPVGGRFRTMVATPLP